MTLFPTSENHLFEEGDREGDTVSPCVNNTLTTEWDNTGDMVDGEYLEQLNTENGTRMKQSKNVSGKMNRKVNKDNA